MKSHVQLAAEEAEAFKQGIAIHASEKQRELVAIRTAAELIEIKFLLRAILENGGMNVGGASQKE